MPSITRTLYSFVPTRNSEPSVKYHASSAFVFSPFTGGRLSSSVAITFNIHFPVGTPSIVFSMMTPNTLSSEAMLP